MKRSEADVISQKSYTSAETRNAVSHLQTAESLHEISVKIPTLRDYFAAKALQAIADPCHSPELFANRAYEIADAMLKAREE